MTEVAPSQQLPRALTLPRRATNLAAAFIDNHLVHNASPKVSYVGDVDMFLDEPAKKEQKEKTLALWDEVKAEKDILFQQMQAAQTKLAKKYPNMNQVDLHSCTWPQVMQELDRAKSMYTEERIKGPRGKIVLCLRKLGENASVFQRWIQLLPSGDYGSGICGAFQLVLSAASRMHEVRMCVYDVLRDISEAIYSARRYVQIYSDTENPYRLSQCTAGLYKAVLVALQHTMRFYTETSKMKFFKVVVGQDEYEEELVASIQAIKKHAAKVESEAELCSQERMRRMDDRQQLGISLQQKSIELQMAVYEQIYKLFLANPVLDPVTREPRAGKVIEPDDAQQYLTNFISKPETTIESQNKDMKPSQVLALLEYDDSAAPKDRAYCKALGQSMTADDKDRASFVANSKNLHSWLVESIRSRALLINGNGEGTAFTSYLSYLCAEISQLYKEADNTLTINYFCGLHTDSRNDPRANACGMMISLIGQILESQIRPDLSFINEGMIKKLKKGGIGVLSRLFRKLVKQLPEDMVVFCFIDTISVYETSSRWDDTLRAVECLMGLVDDRKLGAVFKLLATAPGKSLHLHRYVEEEDVFEVPTHIDGNRQGVVDLRGVSAAMEENSS